MRKILFSTFFTLLALGTFAQSPLPKGKAQINAGAGFSNWGVPLYVGFDYGVHPDISLGGEISYRNYKSYGKWGKYKIYDDTNIWGFAFNANYHFNTILKIPSEWDFYAGLSVGFWTWNYSNYNGKIDDDYSRTSGLGLTGQIGGRYYFNDKFGLNLEVGGGNVFSSGKFGVTIKL